MRVAEKSRCYTFPRTQIPTNRGLISSLSYRSHGCYDAKEIPWRDKQPLMAIDGAAAQWCMRNGEQSTSLDARKRISAFGIVFRPLLFMIYLVRRSMNRGSMTGNICDRNGPARCATHGDRKFALLNRARLRSSFDRTVLRELNSESNLGSIASFVRIVIHLSTMLSSQTILLFIIVTVRFNDPLARILIAPSFS
jgi:hypothetical protein